MSRTHPHRFGFSIIEVSVASVLMVLLSLLISSAWIGLGRPLLETTYRCRIAQEASLAVTSLARDLGGCLPDNSGSTGTKQHYRLVGRTQPSGTELWLCFDGGTTPNGQADWSSPDIVVVYQAVDDALVRTVSNSGAEFIVARNVGGLSLNDSGGELEIELIFNYRDLTQTYTLVAKNP